MHFLSVLYAWSVAILCAEMKSSSSGISDKQARHNNMIGRINRDVLKVVQKMFVDPVANFLKLLGSSEKGGMMYEILGHFSDMPVERIMLALRAERALMWKRIKITRGDIEVKNAYLSARLEKFIQQHCASVSDIDVERSVEFACGYVEDLFRYCTPNRGISAVELVSKGFVSKSGLELCRRSDVSYVARNNIHKLMCEFDVQLIALVTDPFKFLGPDDRKDQDLFVFQKRNDGCVDLVTLTTSSIENLMLGSRVCLIYRRSAECPLTTSS